MSLIHRQNAHVEYYLGVGGTSGTAGVSRSKSVSALPSGYAAAPLRATTRPCIGYYISFRLRLKLPHIKQYNDPPMFGSQYDTRCAIRLDNIFVQTEPTTSLTVLDLPHLKQ